MSYRLILPIEYSITNKAPILNDVPLLVQAKEWVNEKINLIKHYKQQSSILPNFTNQSNYAVVAERMVKILTHRFFNFQSKKNIAPLMLQAEENLATQVKFGQPINLFLLYNGGYRASSYLNDYSFVLSPDLTEAMLLYQITMLQQKISEIYPLGIQFTIIINNGVAEWVNEIPRHQTEGYAYELKKMIQHLGVSSFIKVLVQSELKGYHGKETFNVVNIKNISEKEQQNVARFLGRKCTKEEAEFRASLYDLAEQKWAETLLSIIKRENALPLRQVPHPCMLSFRAFPGAAIRSQNGSFGFELKDNKLLPKLITSEGVSLHGVSYLPYTLQEIHYKNTSQ